MFPIPKSGVIKITHYVNPHMFFFKYDDDSSINNREALDALERKIQHYVSQKRRNNNSYAPVVGELVLVRRFSAGIDKWIRARVDHEIKYSKQTEYIMWAIDYGFPIRSTDRWIRDIQCLDLQTYKQPSIFMGGLNAIVPGTAQFNFQKSKTDVVKTDHWSQSAIVDVENHLVDAESVKFEYENNIKDHLFGKITIRLFNGKLMSLSERLQKLEEAVESRKNFLNDYNSLQDKPYWEQQRQDGFYEIQENTFESHLSEHRLGSESSTCNDEKVTQKVNEWQERNVQSQSPKNDIYVTPTKDYVQKEERPVAPITIKRLVQKSPNVDDLSDKLETCKIPMNKRYDFAQNETEKAAKENERIASLKLAKINKIEEKTKLLPAGYQLQTPSTNNRRSLNTSYTSFANSSSAKMERRTSSSHYTQALARENGFSAIHYQTLLIHSHESNISTSPISSIAEAHFTDEVHAELRTRKFNALFRIQTYGWPHLMRGNSLVIVNSALTAKTWTYLPAVCSLISERVSDDRIVKGDGPVTIILCANSSEVGKVFKYCDELLKGTQKNIKCIQVCRQRDENKTQYDLLNGVEILITTVPCLNRLMRNPLNFFNKNRMSTIVFDDIDLVFDRFSTEIQFIYESFCDLETQVIVTARTWHKVLKKFCKRKDVLLCIGAYIEAAIYAGTEMAVQYTQNRQEDVISYVRAKPYEEELTIIVCNDFSEVQNLVSILHAASCSFIYCHENSDSAEIEKIKNMLDKSNENGVLVCTDGVLSDLDIRHAQHIIHYSLPPFWTTFSQRFSLSFDYHENFLEENRIRKGPSTSMVFVDKNNNEALPRLIDFMRNRCSTEVSKNIIKLAEAKYIEREENRSTAYNPFCKNLLTLGVCDSRYTCASRHVIIKSDRPRDDLPRNGTVKFQIIKTHSPVQYTVRLLEHKAIGRTKWEKIPQVDNYISFQMDFGNYFKDPNMQRIHHPPTLGDICAINTGEGYKRCKIIAIDETNPSSIKLKVLCIDSNETTTARSTEMMVLPDKFKEYPPQAVDIRICGVIPNDLDTEWDRSSTQLVKDWLKGSTNYYLEGQIDITLMDCIWVNSVDVVENLTSLNQKVRSMSIKTNLIEKSFGVADTKALDLLRKMAESAGILDTRPYIPKPFVPLPQEEIQRRGRRGETLAERPNHIVSNEIDPTTQVDTSNSLQRMDSIQASNIVSNGIDPTTQVDTSNSLQRMDSIQASNQSVLSINHQSSSNQSDCSYGEYKEKWETLIPNQFNDVFIWTFFDPERVYVRKCSEQQRTKMLYDKIDEFTSNSDNLRRLSRIEVGQLCLAKVDGEYERSKILSVNDNDIDMLVEVFFVDFGRTVHLPLTEIIEIPARLIEMLPFQAINCKVVGIRPLHNAPSWDSHICDQIYFDILEKCSNIFVRAMQPEKVSNKVNCNSYESVFVHKKFGNINKLIISKYFAESDPMTCHFIDIVVDRSFFKTNDENSDESDWDDKECSASFDAGGYLEKDSQYKPLLQQDGGSDYGGSDQLYELDIQFDDDDICKLLNIPLGTKILKDDENTSQPALPPLPASNGKIEEKMLPAKSIDRNDNVGVKTNVAKSSVIHPNKVAKVTWDQTDELIILVITAPDVTEYFLKITSKILHFCYQKDIDKFATLLHLFGCVDVNYVSHEIRGLNVVVTLLKTIPALRWPRLIVSKVKNQFIKSKLDETQEHDFDDDGQHFSGENNIDDGQSSSDDEEYESFSGDSD